ncbi:MAG: hypothetical protein WC661_05870 [Opitutaceae bacterium]|jgi:hypothetical protein
MKLLLPVLALLIVTAAVPVDAVAANADGASPTQELAVQKPWRLLIACATMKTPPPKDPDGGGGFVVNKEFLAFAKVTTVPVDANDVGTLTGKDGLELQYRVKQEKDQKTFSLNLQLKARVGGIQEINSNITIPGGTWVIIGLTSREETRKLKSGETTTDKFYTSVAVRLDPAEAAK